jgi:mannose-6-phosphate isomerase-like protein (cupin superfamily)
MLVPQSVSTDKGNQMHHSTTVLGLAVTTAFIVGISVSPWAMHVIPLAHADGAPLAPAMIDLTALHHGDLPRTGYPEMNAKGLVTTDNATIGIQSGNVAKHTHQKTDEVQLILEGSGTMWLGAERKEFKPGTLIIIPRGTAHAGSIVSNGPVKALAIKIPPQAKDDIVFVN